MPDQRIGFACKLMTEETFADRKAEKLWYENYNTKSTTVTSLDKLPRSAAIDKLCGIIQHNIDTILPQ